LSSSTIAAMASGGKPRKAAYRWKRDR
jgi:hypothetical protein